MNTEFLGVIETALINSNAGDPIELPLMDFEQSSTDQSEQPQGMDGEVTPPISLQSLDEFMGGWEFAHAGLGQWVGKDMVQPCPLETLAMSPNGKVAGEAVYNLLASNPTIAKYTLSKEKGMIGQAFVVGVHGYFCLQMVAASKSSGFKADAESPHEEPQFRHNDGGPVQ